ncbi:MAG: hypothetical protein OES47_13965 [Acidobacteriota bacterium]|nr:hypothetical protein [Acidobacteriota bacterium]
MFTTSEDRRLDVAQETIATTLSFITCIEPAPSVEMISRSGRRRRKKMLVCHEEIRVALFLERK